MGTSSGYKAGKPAFLTIMIRNIKCPYTACDSNNPFEAECMYGLTPHLIRYALDDGEGMCEYLKREVVRQYKSNRKLLDNLVPRI